ncbi:matrixin family metalloprotease [Agathobaculum sp.]
MAHEFGHAMGLSEHNCKASTIMCQTAEERTASAPTAEDCHAINHLYNK